MKTKISLFTFLLLSQISLIFGQNKNEIDVRNLNTDEFPVVKGDFWIRNPDGISTKEIEFFEDDKLVKPTIGTIKKSDSLSDSKAIVFLILNGHSKSELDWYKEVLKTAISSSAIKGSDKVEIITFCCKDKNGFLFPSKISFSSNKEEMLARIDNIQYKKDANCTNKSQLHLAINEVLENLEKENLTIPTALFVLSDNSGMRTDINGLSPLDRSKRINVPIYGITYTKDYYIKYDIQDLCSQSYGIFYQNNNNDLVDVSENLKTYLINFIERNSGIFYEFSYNSSLEKDGKSHTIKINTKSNGQSAFALVTPNKNIIEWIQANLILSIILFVLLIALTILIFQQNKKNKLKKSELENKRKAELMEVDKTQKEAELRIAKQQEELEKIKQKEKEKLQNLANASNLQHEIEEDAIQLKKMLEKGNLPWFVYGLGDTGGNFQIQKRKLAVGRDPVNDWVINHQSVSKKHFNLIFNDYVYTIEDINSTNGVIVNGQKINKTQLKHGDLIKIGDITLTFYI